MKASEIIKEVIEIVKNVRVLWALLLVSLGYTGVNEYQQYNSAVTPTMATPEAVSEPIEHEHKDWQPIINKAVRALEKRQNESFHGGS
jgi:hypothetical protein